MRRRIGPQTDPYQWPASPHPQPSPDYLALPDIRDNRSRPVRNAERGSRERGNITVPRRGSGLHTPPLPPTAPSRHLRPSMYLKFVEGRSSFQSGIFAEKASGPRLPGDQGYLSLESAWLALSISAFVLLNNATNMSAISSSRASFSTIRTHHSFPRRCQGTRFPPSHHSGECLVS